VNARQELATTSLASLLAIRGVAKKSKPNHGLPLQLWDPGNADAMILATMLMALEHLSVKEIEGTVNPLTYYKLIDELVYNALAKTSCADATRAALCRQPAHRPCRNMM
jgi:hypothetical protein